MKLILYILPLVHLMRATTIDKCGSKLLAGCFCGETFVDRSRQFLVECKNLGFNNTKMLEELPEQVTVLTFVGNHIGTLDSNVFGMENLTELTVIDMSDNGIREIKGKAFHHVPNVERLILNHNNISISTENDGNFHHRRMFSNLNNLQELHLTNAFADNTDAALANNLHDIFVNSNLSKLYKLHLEQNEIKYFLDGNVFCDLPELHDLYLGNNNIPSLNFNITCLKKLRYLDLEYNNITKFSQFDLDMFDFMANSRRNQSFMMEINGNPFRCDNAVKNLYNWIRRTNVNIRNKQKLECHQDKYGNKRIINLKNLAEIKHEKISQALTVLIVILVIILMTLLSAYVYLKKDYVRTKLSPFFETVSRKVQYTTIESQDV